MLKLFNIDELPEGTFLISFNIIDRYQREDSFILEKPNYEEYQKDSFCGGQNTIKLVTYKYKIVLPQKVQKYVMIWYHIYLLCNRLDKTEAMIHQHLYWPGIREVVQKEVTRCDMCQRTNQPTTKYGKLRDNVAEETPWNKLCVYLIDLYKICRKGKDNLIFKVVMMIDPVTGS